MTFRVDDLETYTTELGCLVESRRQCNHYGLEIEHVVLSEAPTHDEPLRTTEGESSDA